MKKAQIPCGAYFLLLYKRSQFRLLYSLHIVNQSVGVSTCWIPHVFVALCASNERLPVGYGWGKGEREVVSAAPVQK